MQVHSISQQTARQGPTCKQRGPGLPQTPACLRPLCSGVGTQDKEKKAWYQLRPSHCQLPTIGPISPLLGDLTFLINTMNLSDHVVAKLVGSLIVQDLLSHHPAATSPSRLPSCLPASSSLASCASMWLRPGVTHGPSLTKHFAQ